MGPKRTCTKSIVAVKSSIPTLFWTSCT